jgi:hypothetical protein
MTDERLVSDEEAAAVAEDWGTEGVSTLSEARNDVEKLLRDREARIEMYGRMVEQARVIPLLKESITKANARIAVLREAMERFIESTGLGGITLQGALDNTDEAAEALLAVKEAARTSDVGAIYRTGVPPHWYHPELHEALDRYDKATGKS